MLLPTNKSGLRLIRKANFATPDLLTVGQQNPLKNL
jgi:hypothetical protein